MKRKILSIFMISIMLVGVFIFSSCEKVENHTIFLTNENQRLSSVEGNGVYKTGEKVTIKATAKTSDSTFVLWIKDGYIISYENPYSFTANEMTEGKYTAVYSNEYLELYTLTNAKLSQTFDNTTTLSKISSLKLFLDNKQYYQENIYSTKDIEISNNSISLDEQVSSNYVLKPEIVNNNNCLYGTISLTYQYIDAENNITESDATFNFTIILNNGVLSGNILTINNITLSTAQNSPILELQLTKLQKPE